MSLFSLVSAVPDGRCTIVHPREHLFHFNVMYEENLEVVSCEREKVLYFRRWTDNGEVFVACNFSGIAATISLPILAGSWSRSLDSAEARWLRPSRSLSNSLGWESATTLTLSP